MTTNSIAIEISRYLVNSNIKKKLKIFKKTSLKNKKLMNFLMKIHSCKCKVNQKQVLK